MVRSCSEDTDIPRIYPGGVKTIYSHQLKLFSSIRMPRPFFKKDRLDIYESVLDQLKKEGLVYACQCTRKMLGSNAIYVQAHAEIYSSTSNIKPFG